MMDAMNSVDFQTQLTSIMETMAKTAVAEISKLLEANCLFLRLEISRCTRENDALLQKCQDLEIELQAARKNAVKMDSNEASFTHSELTDAGHQPVVDSVFGKEWSMNMWRHESNVGQHENEHVVSSVNTTQSANLLHEKPDMVLIKEEMFEDCYGRNKTEEDQGNSLREMLVQVECKGDPKWIRIPVKNDCYDFDKFIIEASMKFNLPRGTSVVLKNSEGFDVDADVFDELVRTTNASFKILCSDKSDESEISVSSCPELSSSSVKSKYSDSTAIPQSVKTRKRQLLEENPDCNVAKDLVYAALHSKLGGFDILKEYEQTNTLSDKTRRKLVNILVADMVESHGRIPPVNIRISYALGIITLFPHLKDKCSPTGYEQYYDPRSGLGYLAYRLKTVQRNSGNHCKVASKFVYQDGPKTLREISSSEQLSGDECTEAISLMKRSTDKTVIMERMRATFKYRQNEMHDPEKSSSILEYFPRFLDTPGLIDQDFKMLFGDEISSNFVSNWPTFYKPRIIANCRNMPFGAHVDDLLFGQQESDYGWDSDVAAILLLVQLLPPTVKTRKLGKVSTAQAAGRVVKFMKVGMNINAFLEQVGSTKPFLLCVGESRSSIQKFYVIVDQKAIPCTMKTAFAAFDELFKAHFVFAASYDEALYNFYTFIQTTVYGIDVGTAKESPRVKEIRVRIQNTEL
ncbi:uncharacterized protein LOC130426051 isoform X2 [Triplophysa dalaica]|uniref:uncharacterized protein LOC130426051 isoform X2 n=1 Tax=Triplophysa dalaica TaxID=1582913 RepID=UPI0024DFCD3D|nr:uncharacterized protein LOC130426051 isoform X2 [Triplophysa dalaica]